MRNFQTKKQKPSVLLSPRGGASLLMAGLTILVLFSCKNNLIDEIDVMRADAISPVLVIAYGTDSTLKDEGNYDFDQVSVGKSNEVTFTIKNSGESPLSIDLSGLVMTMGSDTEEDTFTLTATPAAEVAVDGTTSFTVSFTPESEGAKSARVTIPSNDFNTPSCSFTLTGAGGVIILTTGSVSSIEATTANCSGDITNDGGTDIIERGICWGTEPSPTIHDNFISDGTTGTGEYSNQLKNLTCDTLYYIRAYASNGISTGYGTQVSFRTKPAVVTDVTVSAVPYAAGSGMLDVSWTSSNSSSTTYDVYYCKAAETRPDTANGPTDLTTTSCTFTGLDNYTDYNVWIIARNSTGSTAFSTAGTGMAGILIESITLGGKYSYYLPGVKEQLTVEINPSTATNQTLTWACSSSDVSVSSGEITGITDGAGSATITAAATDGSGIAGSYGVATKAFVMDATGPSGGKLFYDKTGYSEGWRYLEYGDYSDYGIWATASEANTDIPGTAYILGTGKSNTDIILQKIGENAVLASFCRNSTLGGFTDWYMPSIDEASHLINNTYLKNSTIDMASSTQPNASSFRYISNSGSTQSVYNCSKDSSNCRTIAIRQF